MRDNADWYDTSKEVNVVLGATVGTLDKNASNDLQSYLADYTGKGVYVNKTEEDMIKVRNLGKKSLEEVIQKLHSLGLDLKKEVE